MKDLVDEDLLGKGNKIGDNGDEFCGDRVDECLLGKGDKIGDNGEEFCVKDTLGEVTLGDKIGLDNEDL